MIPSMIFLGLIGGLVPRYRWWSVPVIGVVWSILLMTYGDSSLSVLQIFPVGFVIGALNGAVGVAFTWMVWKLIQLMSGWLRARTTS